ncbi:MAG: NAD(P)H-hydrate dehydratase [Desulfobacterales bacterium]|nr:NAD(P)H-hydrate dehydratase [Desulfobacterales bacterium]MDD4072671.1 NAD(P)H-hydrate dehydratase [Desulfobacterales bacterium]MDD4391780.1 NAD(P)H-hydrate dehydratase [Desulfobacterales bacterium]
MKISTVKQMRNLDRNAIEIFGIKDELLMENAGLASCTVMLTEFGIRNKTFIVFCGIGNNGGDGFVVARKIHSNGGIVKVYILGDPARFKATAGLNMDIVSRLPVAVKQVDSIESVRMDVLHSDAIVDAIFGTGLARDVGGIYADAIDLINASGKTVFSLDIPSGVNGDTGQIMGNAVKADYTITFGLPKIGNILYPGYDLCGKLYVTHISFPPAMYMGDGFNIQINNRLPLPKRDKNGHKGTFGQTLFIAGAASYFGAPYFAAESFLKAGGGYSRLACPKSITPFIAGKGSEIVFIPQHETPSGSISLKNKPDLLELADKMDMIVIGPGLSLNPETGQLIRELAEEIHKPMLIDGDGISAICDHAEIIRRRKSPTILTPHMGEMSRITHISTAEINTGKIDILKRAATDLNASIVLKGAHSLIGLPDGQIFINMSGNPGMATAGSGDVLTGTIAAMSGLGLTIEEAVRKGVFIHGLAGDMAAGDRGEDGITAQDILNYLPEALKADRNGLSKMLQERYTGVRVV